MSIFIHGDVLFEDNKYPCLLADIETDYVLYVNSQLEKLLTHRVDIIGEKYYDVIVNSVGEKNIPYHFDLREGKSDQMDIYDNYLNRAFTITMTQVEYQGTAYKFCKYVSKDQKDVFSFEMAMSQCIAFSQLHNVKKSSHLLKILGTFYEADKSFLYQIDRKNKEIICVDSWNANEDVIIVSDVSDKFDVQEMLDWYDTRDEVDIVEADKYHNYTNKNSVEMRILEAFQIDNMIVGTIEDFNKEVFAVVGVSNRKRKKEDLRLLQAVTKFLEQDVVKTELSSTLEHLGDIDLLTGFYSRIKYARDIEYYQKELPKSMGVVFANVNGLKSINAEFGYAKGDSHIKKASELLGKHIDSEFYRIAGDEFVGLLPNIEKSQLEDVVMNLYEELKEQETPLFALGYTWEQGKYDLFSLIGKADNLMYINKQDYYHTSNRRFDDMSDSILGNLLKCLEKEEFIIYLQPQVDLRDDSLYGAEALVRRFDKKSKKIILPDEFIPLYEQKSVVRHIDIYVVKKVCEILAEWLKSNLRIPISVNLSRVTLLEFGIVDTIARICDSYKVPRELLVIEVTERVGIIEDDVESSLMMQFKEKGFRISLDDFGCAYSNIVTLAQIEVDEVKIDKSLVDHLTTNKNNHILVKNVLNMCNELDDTSTLAEGIEYEKQANMLRELGCHLGQGYFYSRPITIEDFVEKYIDM